MVLPVEVRIFRILGRGKVGSRLGLLRKIFFHVAFFINFFRTFLKLLSLSGHFGSIGEREKIIIGIPGTDEG